MNLRATVFTVLEALEDGDVDLAVSLLTDALEDGASDRPHRCGDCGAAFRWPGERDRHRIVRGHELELVAA